MEDTGPVDFSLGDPAPSIEDEFLAGVLSEMRTANDCGDPGDAHPAADYLLYLAAEYCGVPKEILDAYDDVEKWHE